MLVLLLMAGLTAALYVVTFSDTKQSVFYSDRGELLQYAQDGVSLALMELNYGTGGADGKIGTELWTTTNDLGKDGKASTKDEGEGDGIPTPGEANLSAVAIGPTASGVRLLVRSADTAWTGTKRIVSVAYNSRSMVAVEAYGGGASAALPGTGAMFVPGNTIYTLSGSNLTIDGRDTNPDGTAGPNPVTYGVTTPIGSPAGANKTALDSQLSSWGKSILGIGGGTKGKASLSEVVDPKFETIFNNYKSVSGVVNMAPGAYTKNQVVIGDYTKNLNQITYIKGDVQFSDMIGAGVLLVEGNLKISGQAMFAGLVMVRGDCDLTGGGNGVHIYGALMVQNPLTPTQIKMTGNAHVIYSSNGLKWAKGQVGGKMAVRYWNQLK